MYRRCPPRSPGKGSLGLWLRNQLLHGLGPIGNPRWADRPKGSTSCERVVTAHHNISQIQQRECFNNIQPQRSPYKCPLASVSYTQNMISKYLSPTFQPFQLTRYQYQILFTSYDTNTTPMNLSRHDYMVSLIPRGWSIVKSENERSGAARAIEMMAHQKFKLGFGVCM